MHHPVQDKQYPGPHRVHHPGAGQTVPCTFKRQKSAYFSLFFLFLSFSPSPLSLLSNHVAPWPAKVPLWATVSSHRHFRVTANHKQTKVARTIIFIIKLHLKEQTRLYTEACNGTCQKVQYYTEKCVVTTD